MEYLKKYIEVSNAFRVDASHKNIAKLYDLKSELEQVHRTKPDNFTLSNICTLLEFHQTAYEIFKTIANVSNRKEKSKLYVLETKAKSHGDNFILKDIRKLKIKPKKVVFSDKSFEKKVNQYKINVNPIIFGKLIDKEKIKISISEGLKFENYLVQIIEQLNFLSDCKNEIINYFNSELSECMLVTATEDWYYLLDEVYGVLIMVGFDGKLYTEIGTGHDSIDHLLDIEFEENRITDMRIDG